MLPIIEVLPPLKQALSQNNTAVLIAPPGAGKTTVVPLELMTEPWARGGRLIVLEPRRLAARGAAARMAQTLGEPIGETVGFRVRMQSKVSSRTRIEVVTEGIFTRMILEDPGLEGVSCVLFDEFHERSLDADLGLALARDAQTVIREDLRLLVMSATLDGAAVGRMLGDAPVIESQGRLFPIETRYLATDPGQRIEAQMARAVSTALVQTKGDILAFLPGQAEIIRTQTLLAEARPDLLVTPLFGALGLEAQNLAITPDPGGRRKLVLATSIAETSLTIQGVKVVIDSGLARVPRFDPASGLTRLQTLKVSRAGADQRRGRAGRTEPGVCYRLWDEQVTRGLRPFEQPEILETDLSGLALDLAIWGAGEGEGLVFLDRPPRGALAEARSLLTLLGALENNGAPSPHGKAMARLSLPPRLAHMVVAGGEHGNAARASLIAAILSERGLGGADVDLHQRLQNLERDQSPRARDAKALAARWARQAGEERQGKPTSSDGRTLLAAYPERVAQRRSQGLFKLASGRAAALNPSEHLAAAPWLVVADLAGGGPNDQIRLAASIEESELLSLAEDRIETLDVVETAADGAVRARRVRRLGALVLSERELSLSEEVLRTALVQEVHRRGLEALPWGEGAKALRARTGFLRSLFGEPWPDFSEEALLASTADWLEPVLKGRRSLAGIEPGALEGALLERLSWEARGELDRLAPARWAAPTGSSLPIDYSAEGGPRLEVRVQELFGLGVHPHIAGGKVALSLALTSPARRPLQVTKDLPGFWRGSWSEVRKEMRGRYPKHPWPEDPSSAAPTTRAKPRGT